MIFQFFSIKLFFSVKIGIFSNCLNHWTQIYQKFSKRVLLIRIDINKVAENGARDKRFWKNTEFSTTMFCVDQNFYMGCHSDKYVCGISRGGAHEYLKKNPKNIE